MAHARAKTFRCTHPRVAENTYTTIETYKRSDGSLRDYVAERCRTCRSGAVTRFQDGLDARRPPPRRTVPSFSEEQPACKRCGLHGDHVCLDGIEAFASRRHAA